MKKDDYGWMLDFAVAFAVMIISKIVFELLSQYGTYKPYLYKKRLAYRDYIFLEYKNMED